MTTTSKAQSDRKTNRQGSEVVKKSPVRGKRRTARLADEATSVSAHDAPETTEIDTPAELVEDTAGTGHSRPRRPRWSTGLVRPRRLVAALLIVVLGAAGGLAGWELYSNHAVAQAEEQAVATAKEYAVTLTSIEAGSIDQNFTDVLDGATGQFKDMYSRSSSQLKQMLVENKATSKGVVVDAGVKSATADQVVVMLFVDQSITNTASPEPRVDRSRVVMTMDKVDGRWLASKVDLP